MVNIKSVLIGKERSGNRIKLRKKSKVGIFKFQHPPKKWQTHYNSLKYLSGGQLDVTCGDCSNYIAKIWASLQ